MDSRTVWDSLMEVCFRCFLNLGERTVGIMLDGKWDVPLVSRLYVIIIATFGTLMQDGPDQHMTIEFGEIAQCLRTKSNISRW